MPEVPLSQRFDHQIDEEMILVDEVSDEAVEAAGSVALRGLPTLPHTYCFACPADKPSAMENKDLRFQALLDQDQIAEASLRRKIGAGSPTPARARPRSVCPHPPMSPDAVGAVICTIDYGVQWARK
jgi:hypothetical protein